MIQKITKADTVDIVGLCMGGALTAITDAYLSASGKDGSAISPCSIRCSITPSPVCWRRSPTTDTVRRLERKMAKEGHLAGETMAGTFDILRANDLIFSYVVVQLADGPGPPGL